MGTQRQRYLFWIRFFIAIFGFLLLTTGTLLWILSIKHILQGDLSDILGPVSASVGIAVSLYAWLFPRSDTSVPINLPGTYIRFLVDQEALLSFIDNLVLEVKNANFKPEYILEIKRELQGQANSTINSHLLNLLSDREAKALYKLLNKNATNEEIALFLMRKIPNIELKIAQALQSFREDYLSLWKLKPVQEKKQ